MLLSQNQKISAELFSGFPKSTSNLEYFQKEVSLGSHFFTEIIDCKKRGYLNAQKAPCQNTYEQ